MTRCFQPSDKNFANFLHGRPGQVLPGGSVPAGRRKPKGTDECRREPRGTLGNRKGPKETERSRKEPKGAERSRKEPKGTERDQRDLRSGHISRIGEKRVRKSVGKDVQAGEKFNMPHIGVKV